MTQSEGRLLSVNFDRLGDQVSMMLKVGGKNFASVVDSNTEGSSAFRDWWHGFISGRHMQLPPKRGTLRMMDVFCGSGGLSLGVSLGARALGWGVKNQLAVDVDNEALRVFAANHKPYFVLNESVSDLVSYSLREGGETVSFPEVPVIRNDRVAALRGSVDVLIGGPPCQGHSTANSKRRYFDSRNLLYLTLPALAVALQVPVVIIENVPGVRASQQGVAQIAWKLLESHGYKLTDGVISASQIGWAQSRRRYFMIASMDCEPLPLTGEVIPALTHPPMSIGDLLEDLLECDSTGFMMSPSILSSENMHRIEALHERGLHDLPDELRNPRARSIGTTYRSVYGRMYWDRPAQTITTGFLTPGRGRFIHPLLPRTIVPREAARIQGFPDSYRFDAFGEEPKRSSLAKWIGDAVPTPMGFAAALSALGGRS